MDSAVKNVGKSTNELKKKVRVEGENVLLLLVDGIIYTPYHTYISYYGVIIFLFVIRMSLDGTLFDYCPHRDVRYSGCRSYSP